MKEYIKNIIAESLKDEVDVDREWERLFSSIEKKTISKMTLLCIYNHRTTKTNQKYPSVNL